MSKPNQQASSQQALNTYIAGVAQRLRLAASLGGAAILTAAAVLVTLGTVLILNAYGFPLRTLPWVRLALAFVLALTAALALILPLLRLTRAASVRRAEQAFTDFEDRLVTFSERERQQQPSPFLELLAADTLTIARESSPSRLAPAWLLLALSTAAAASLALLVWMIAAAPGFLGYGASLLWTGQKAAPLYAIHVAPGDAALRRNTDEVVTAQLTNIQTDRVRLFARYASSTRWEPVDMQPQQGTSGFQFVFASLPEDVEYYVAAGPLTTPHFKLRVVDMPSVTGIHVTYQYPAWTGLKPVSEDNGGDLRAIEDTVAKLEIHTDRPLKDGLMVQDDGTPLKLTPIAANTYQATLKMEKDGAYHIAGADAGQQVRLSEDYFIAANKAEPPQVAIAKPASDYHASPIEEVSVHVKGSADYGLRALALHYAVNGGPEQTVPLLKSPGLHEADGSETLSLESFKLQPGDVVSLYATAKDGHAESKSDITFIQADPFEREYSQSQSGGSGGGGGGSQSNDQGEISRRQKELIAATWKQQNTKDAAPKAAGDAGKFFSDVQSKLRQQVTALSSRVESRDLTGGNETFSGFEEDMQQAAAAMSPAAAKLQQLQWRDAIANEQKALQYLLRAEATFRQIQVAFGNRSAGGGDGGGSMGRDLASLLDLELDTQKNQYEAAQTGSSQEQQQKKADDALEKLDALAKRQDELAQQEHKAPQQAFQQRWQQEMLRREAEQLRKQMEQLAQNSQSNQKGQEGQQGEQGQPGEQSGQQGDQSGSQQASSHAGSRSGSQSAYSTPQTAGDPRVQQALSRLRQADDEMRRAASPQSGQANAQQAANEAARRAAEALKQATGLLGGAQQQQASGKLGSLARDADRLAQQERAQAERIRKFVESQSDPSLATATRQQMMDRLAERNRMADDRQILSDGLARLEKQLRDTQRELAPMQPGVSGKLGNALSGMDENELGNRVQRSADWLRRGINPESNGTEDGIRAGLDKLSQQVRQAEQAMGAAPQTGQQRSGDQVAALDALDRFRSRIESLTRPQGAGSQQNGRQSQPGNQPGGQNGAQRGNRQANQAIGQQGGQSGNQPGQQSAANGQGGRNAQGDQSGQLARNGATGSGPRNGGDAQPSSDLGNTVNRGGDGDQGSVWGNLNSGNNRFGHARSAGDPPDPANPADTERVISQATRELNQLRQAAGNDLAAQKEIQQLARQMQQLDPKRFPGNPALVEQLNAQVLSQVDKLELELRQNADKTSNQIRTARSRPAAPPYQDAVADYYRRLSSNPSSNP
jgi:hypothetical protein